MKRRFPIMPDTQRPVLALLILASLLSGCTVGPDFRKPAVTAPENWTAWHSGDPSLRAVIPPQRGLDPRWWQHFNDPILDELVSRALAASPDIRTAALRFSGARVQNRITASSGGPSLNATANVSRVQTSANSPSTRALKEVLPEPDELINLMTDPYNWYQAGLDFSWEIDLWGHVRRATEASAADSAAQGEMLKLAKLSIVGDVVDDYYRLRAIQQQRRLAEDNVRVMEQRLSLIHARARGGEQDYTDTELQQSDLSATRAGLVDLRQQEGIAMNQLLLLLGEHPGALAQELAWHPSAFAAETLPSLSMGLPSDVALNRPDIRAAEARLHAATARIGVAKAELYPAITLGAHIGSETYTAGNFGEWASRSWSVGPGLDLPLFDRGRRKATVVLRETEQQQAAVDFHKTVLQAWQEIDDALSGYAAAQQKLTAQEQRVRSANEALSLIQARYEGGLTSFINVLDSERSLINARQSLVLSQRDLSTAWAAVNRATGNYPR